MPNGAASEDAGSWTNLDLLRPLSEVGGRPDTYPRGGQGFSPTCKEATVKAIKRLGADIHPPPLCVLSNHASSIQAGV
jgi:hypothetical protein